MTIVKTVGRFTRGFGDRPFLQNVEIVVAAGDVGGRNLPICHLRVGSGFATLAPGIVAGIHANAVPEDPGEIVAVGKAAGVGDELDRVAPFAQQDSGVFDTYPVEVLARRDADGPAETAGQVFLRDLETVGELADAVQKGLFPAHDAEGGIDHQGELPPLRGGGGGGAHQIHQEAVCRRGGLRSGDGVPGMGAEAVQHAFHAVAAGGKEEPAALSAAVFQHPVGGGAAEGQTQKQTLLPGEKGEALRTREGRGLMGLQGPGLVLPGEIQTA